MWAMARVQIYDNEIRLSPDLGQGALAIAASRLRLSKWGHLRSRNMREIEVLSASVGPKITYLIAAPQSSVGSVPT